MQKKLLYNFKSSIFKRVFFSYIVIIIFAFIAYSIITIKGTAQHDKNEKLQAYQLLLKEAANEIDMQLLSGRNIVANINNSKDIDKIYLHALSNQNPLSAYTLYRSLNELKAITRASNNSNIYNVMLFINGYNRVYTNGEVILMKDQFKTTHLITPRLVKGTVNEVANSSNLELVFNKEFMIYSETYGYHAGNNKGMICVLYDTDALLRLMDHVIRDVNISIYDKDTCIMDNGYMVEKGIVLTQNSVVNGNIVYKMSIDQKKFGIGYKPFVSATVVFGLCTTLFYIILAFIFATKYYTPIEHIEQMLLGGGKPTQKGDMADIIDGIGHLIGERNGYAEKMVTIEPYAKQGLLHGIVSGNASYDKIKILADSERIDLKRLYFLIAVVNVVDHRLANESKKERYEMIHQAINDVCKKYTDEQTTIASYNQDSENTYLIINSNYCENLEGLLYTFQQELEERLESEACEITIGVDEVRENFDEIKIACMQAVQALKGMMTGGRGSVYFYELEDRNKVAEYYFPKDSQKRLVKGLKENNLEMIKGFFEELYRKNVIEQEMTVSDSVMFVDELHMTVLRSVKAIHGFDTSNIRIEKIKGMATLEEVLAYYDEVLETVIEKLPKNEERVVKQHPIEDQIINYINENYRQSDMSLAHMTKQFNVSTKYISQVCKRAFGMSYLQYIQEKRIHYSAQLIKETNNNLEQISQECGYTSLLTFRRNFKTIMGVTPSDYRIEESHE